jgi:hypothetical protein
MSKYRVVPIKKDNYMTAYEQVCIGCGKKRTAFRMSLLPIPNSTNTASPTWIDCHILGIHNFFDTSKVEAIKK